MVLARGAVPADLPVLSRRLERVAGATLILVAVFLGCGAAWARRAMYAMLTGYTCLAIAVAAMGVVMYANDDPDASLRPAGGSAPADSLTTSAAADGQG